MAGRGTAQPDHHRRQGPPAAAGHITRPGTELGHLNIHLAPELADFAEENAAWLRLYRLPAYAPDLNPAEGIWSLLKRSMVNFAAADLDGLVRIVKRKLKKIQYRPHLIDGCLAAAGLTIVSHECQ